MNTTFSTIRTIITVGNLAFQDLYPKSLAVIGLFLSFTITPEADDFGDDKRVLGVVLGLTDKRAKRRTVAD